MHRRSRSGALVARILDRKTDERAWRVGADGEEAVGARLGRLRQHGWQLLHAVPVGERGSDIDHVLIGAAGVFTVNTKNHPGARVWVGQHTIKVNGHNQPYLRNSRHEAQRAARLLSAAVGWPVPVLPAIVILTCSLPPNLTVKQLPDDVLVLDRWDVPGAFKRRPQILTDQQIAELFEYARRRTTWSRPAADRSLRAPSSLQ
jgi:hypothetical protein